MGVDAAVLDEARVKHQEAHFHWEWWSATNGAHFHNPQQFEDSINKGMVASQAGIKLLDDAMSKRRPVVAAPAPASAPTKTSAVAAPNVVAGAGSVKPIAALTR
jgi:hypothetical protein